MTDIRLLDRLWEGVLLIDERLRVVYQNEYAKNYLGNVYGLAISEALRVPRLSEIVDAFLANTETVIETTFVKSGVEKHFMIRTINPHIIFQDISERKLLESAKMDFVNSLVHEFSTPLTVINGYTQLLMDERSSLPAETSGTVERIMRSTQRLSKLVDELAMLSNLELHNYKSTVQTINLNTLVEEVVAETEPKWKKKDLTISVNAPTDLYLKSDALLVYRIVANVFSNSIKYSYMGGKVEIQLSKDKNSVSVSIQDHGMGIRSEEIPRIFERFYRSSSAKASGMSGLGLGLALVKHALSVIGGTIEVNSRYMLGTEVTVKFPRVD
ncbi:MAG: Histidine kinase [Thermotogales bacterium 46_20]|nr:MAG: Histidine kinase [Thermotogales bacterium 46_20]